MQDSIAPARFFPRGNAFFRGLFSRAEEGRRERLGLQPLRDGFAGSQKASQG